MTSAVLDKTYPYQVALPDKACMGALYTLIHDFGRHLSMARRTHTVVKDSQWRVVFCFAVEADEKAKQIRRRVVQSGFAWQGLMRAHDAETMTQAK